MGNQGVAETVGDQPAEPAATTVKSAVRQIDVTAEDAGQRLDKVLAKVLPGVPRSRLFRLVRKGEVRVNGRRAGPEQRLQAGDRLRIPPVHEAAPMAPGPRVSRGLVDAVQAAIIHEDPRLIVVNKPSGIAVHGGSGVSAGVIEALRALRPEETLELAHRLDRDTSGLLLISRRSSALRELHALLRDGLVQKSYLVLVKGNWQLGNKRVDAPLQTEARVHGERTVRVGAGGKEAVSEFRLVQSFGARASLLEVRILTGRTHQIRVHALHCGHPVAGDDKYGDAQFNATMHELGLRRMFLHAHAMSFAWPGGSEQSFNVPLPPDLAQVLEQLGARGARVSRSGQGKAAAAKRPRQRYQR